MDNTDIENQIAHDQYVREALQRANVGDSVTKEFTNDGDRIAVINKQNGDILVVEDLSRTDEE